METIVNEIANVGITLLLFVGGAFVINYLDRKVFNKNRYDD
tara:strand:+ start:311 stop:433 length:123 start_codon:yes stop_codon:yes gene_type:complete